jgi:hypothetical protein
VAPGRPDKDREQESCDSAGPIADLERTSGGKYIRVGWDAQLEVAEPTRVVANGSECYTPCKTSIRRFDSDRAYARFARPHSLERHTLRPLTKVALVLAVMVPPLSSQSVRRSPFNRLLAHHLDSMYTIPSC